MARVHALLRCQNESSSGRRISFIVTARTGLRVVKQARVACAAAEPGLGHSALGRVQDFIVSVQIQDPESGLFHRLIEKHHNSESVVRQRQVCLKVQSVNYGAIKRKGVTSQTALFI